MMFIAYDVFILYTFVVVGLSLFIGIIIGYNHHKDQKVKK